MQNSKLFDSPTTRVCSVRLNDVETCLAFRVLERLGLHESVTSFSKIARACIALTALQAETLGIPEPSVMQAREELNALFNGVGQQRGRDGLRSQVYSEMRHHVDATRVQFHVPNMQPSAGASPRPAHHTTEQPEMLWWQKLGCCSAEEAMRFTAFLRENGITVADCSYTDWHMHLAGAVNVLERKRPETQPNTAPAYYVEPELLAQAAEREEYEAEQKRLMDEHMRSLQNGQGD